MSYPLVSIDKNAEISNAKKLMEENKIKRLPVISEKKLLGIITISDLSK